MMIVRNNPHSTESTHSTLKRLRVVIIQESKDARTAPGQVMTSQAEPKRCKFRKYRLKGIFSR